ncbi:PPE family protein, SVP subgroup [Mycobacterium sp. Aquia_213]|uniref:PPE family protein, SVP subgroup n=1 Tax=Mycobacterium sp. Aquia_213 TaxID=2991728 RepID=UPI0022712C71|nr:PPE domain-containing protein [Mycobacterium sp. Aquia_213]WAC91639.1 PPE domain-containing protein [Mycobacterium sp. Aquia_213]
MDYALLPPEVNSARIYAGPGSGPMLAAASAWQTLAAELYSTASSYQAAITELTAGPWLGPAAAAMTAAAAPYVSWMRTAAEQAEQAGNRAIAAAAAYEAAFAETVPPPVVAANRSLLAALVATNFLGQNTTAIATTEAQYGEMWAQDTGAMQSYASESASATTLTPFDSPSPSTSTDGPTDQAAAVAQATGSTAGDAQGAVSSAQQAFSAVPNALINLASPQDAFGFGGRDLLGLLADLSAVFLDPEIGAAGLAADTSLGTTALPYDVGGYWTGVHTDDIVSGWAGVQPWPGNAATPPTSFPVINEPASTVSGQFRHAPSVGRLSVPPAWVAAAPELRAMTAALPAATVGAAAQATGSSAGSLFSQMALASMAGRAMAGTTGGGGARLQERIGLPGPKPKGAPPPEPAEVQQAPMGGPITSIAAELRELASLRDAGILTQDEFVEQKQRLLPRDP